MEILHKTIGRLEKAMAVKCIHSPAYHTGRSVTTTHTTSVKPGLFQGQCQCKQPPGLSPFPHCVLSVQTRLTCGVQLLLFSDDASPTGTRPSRTEPQGVLCPLLCLPRQKRRQLYVPAYMRNAEQRRGEWEFLKVPKVVAGLPGQHRNRWL